VIVITALLLALILLSTAIYVIETEKAVPIAASGGDNGFSAYEQNIRATLISALANITSGGNAGVLTADLNELNSAIASHSYQAIIQMNYALLNEMPYQNGVWVSWGAQGYGISSVYSSVTLNSSGLSSSSSLEYSVNVTSELKLAGQYLQVNDTIKQANLTLNLLNEGKPALAQNFTFFFENATDWAKVQAPNVNDFGNGTYAVSFNAETAQSGDPLVVSVNCLDQRGITVGANVTCSNVT
jgi:hypothetical protein